MKKLFVVVLILIVFIVGGQMVVESKAEETKIEQNCCGNK